MANSSRLIAATLLLLSLHSPALAVVVYTESGGGLSFRHDAPTDLGLFMPGVNSVTGQVTFIGDPSLFDPSIEPDDAYMDRTADVFTFEIRQNEQLDSIIMTSFNAAEGAQVFMGLDDGSQYFYSPYFLNFFFPDLAPTLKGALVGLNEDFLTEFSNGGSGANPPLGPGQYTIYIQENNQSATDYTLEFNVTNMTATPESSSVVALSTASACLGFIAFRRSRRRKRAADPVTTPIDG